MEEMDENEFIQFVNSIDLQISDLEKEIEKLKFTREFAKEWYKSKHKSANKELVNVNAQAVLFSSNERSKVNQEINSINKSYDDFPKEGAIEEQALYVLKKVGRIMRLPDWENEFKKIAGEDSPSIRKASLRLREKNLVVKVKFNNANTSVFYGLPQWLVTDGRGKKTFSEEYRPLKKELPFGYDTITFE